MKPHHAIKQHVEHTQRQRARKGKGHKLQWWNLSLIGIGSIVGAGFFLGSGLAIQTAGPSVLILYLISGITAFLVFNALAEMTVNDPQAGSFRTYAKKAFGPSMGFVSGWMYWVSGILIMSSEITALSIFTRFWFPHIPLWIFSIIYTVLGIGINLLGTSRFGKIESLFATVKLATLVIFILFSVLLLTGVIPLQIPSNNGTASITPFFATHFTDLWSSLVFVMFSFGGIAVMGAVANELENRNDVPKAGISMLIVLVLLYVASITLIMKLVPWQHISEDESPFVTALSILSIPFFDSIFNMIIISAAFSTMVGAMFSVTNIIVSLALDKDAPRILGKKTKKAVAIPALLLNGAGVGVTILVSYFLPDQVYEYLVTSAGIMLILNWVTILLSQIKNRSSYKNSKSYKAKLYPYSSYVGILLIAITIAGSVIHQNQRVGFFISLAFIAVIFLSYWIKKKVSV